MVEKAAILTWVKNDLVPTLVNEAKLKIDGALNHDNVRIVSTDVSYLTVTGFALTTPIRAVVVLSADGENKQQEFRLIVKKSPKLPTELYQACQFDKLFANEVLAYQEIIPLLDESDKYPRFFYAIVKENDAVLVMEDFSERGWQMSKSIYDLSLDHILCAAIELGKFHGECYVLKETQPDVFNGIVGKLREARYDGIDPQYQMVLRLSIQRAIKAAKNQFNKEIPEEFLERLSQVLSEPRQFGKNSVVPVEPLAVVNHGDYLRNNIAFAYQDNDPVLSPLSAMMFDLQTVRYCSPMLDLTVLLANSCIYKRRQENLDKIIRTYHAAVCDKLHQKLMIQIPEHFSFNNFYREYAMRSPYGLSISASFLPILYDPVEDFQEQLACPDGFEKFLPTLMVKGGEPVNIELANQVLEIYKLHQKFKLKL